MPRKNRQFRFSALLALLSAISLLTGCVQHRSDFAAASFAPDESNQLVVYTSHKEEVYWPIIKEFEERTGIWVEIVSGGTNEILDRIVAEADSPIADVMFGGGVESLQSYTDYFSPYVPTDARYIDSQYRDPNNLWTPFSSLPVVLIYNTKLLSPGQITGWSDLLNPDFQGEIAFADPLISGSCFTGLVTYQYAIGGDKNEALLRLAKNLAGNQLSSSADIPADVAAGTFLVGVTLEETALKRIAAGDDIALVYPDDGTSFVPDGSALIKGARHVENAKLFLDFTVERDVQQLLTKQFYRRSVRTDIEPFASLASAAEIPQVDYDIVWVSENRDSILMTWQFYLGGGVTE